MSKKTIIFIDDEAYNCKYYLAELRTVFEVLFCEKVMDGLVAIKRTPNADLVIMDIMMPPPPGVQPSGVFRDSTDTGLWLIEQIKTDLVHRPLPVFVLTNRATSTFASFITEVNAFIRAQSGRTKDQVDFRTKLNCQATNIVHSAEAMIGRFT